MKRTLFLLCFFLSNIAASDWKHDLKGLGGFRWDDILHNGPFSGSIANWTEQHCEDIYFVQAGIKERSTWKNCIFVQGMIAGGGLVNELDTGSAWFALGGGQTAQYSLELSSPYEGSYVKTPVYSIHHGSGYNLNFDVAGGFKLFPKSHVSIEPRIGYSFETLKVKHSIRACFQGFYAGGSVPIKIWRGLVLTPDANYFFSGWRNERITAYLPWLDIYYNLHTLTKGSPKGFLGSLELAWRSPSKWHIGAEWFYTHLTVDGVQCVGPCPVDCWRPTTRWVTNQFFVTGGYEF